jgi:hypothetical protein
MKGKIKVEVKTTYELNSFPITTTWSWEQDNTIESLEEWIEVFNMILNNQGFHHSTRVGVLEPEEVDYGADEGEISE